MEIQRASICWFAPQKSAAPSWELNPGHPPWVAGSQFLPPSLLSHRVCSGRKLEPGANPGRDPRHSERRCRCFNQRLHCCAKCSCLELSRVLSILVPVSVVFRLLLPLLRSLPSPGIPALSCFLGLLHAFELDPSLPELQVLHFLSSLILGKHSLYRLPEKRGLSSIFVTIPSCLLERECCRLPPLVKEPAGSAQASADFRGPVTGCHQSLALPRIRQSCAS